MNLDTKNLFLITRKIIIESEQLNYEKGACYGNYFTGSCLLILGKKKEALVYFKKAQSHESYLVKNINLKTRIHIAMGECYRFLDLPSLAFEYYHRGLSIIKKNKNKNTEEKRTESMAYAILSVIHEEMSNTDSVYYYVQKQQNLLRTINAPDIFIDKGYSFIGLGNYYNAQGKLDSAEYYYKKSYQEFVGKKHIYKSDALVSLGDLYLQQGKNHLALQYYLEALPQYEKNGMFAFEADVYKKIGQAYNSLGDKKENYYLNKFTKTKDSLDKSLKLERNFIVSEVMKTEIEQQEVIRNKQKRIWIVIISVLLIISVYLFKKTKDTNNRNSAITQLQLEEKENLISQKEQETQELKLKVNESFEEVIQLAKDNSIEFFTRFQEVYPEVIQNILKIDPKFRVTELTLCAYIFLGFNTKDIALYTFKSMHTVRSRKYNIRKKLNILPEENMELWLKDLIKS